MQLAPVQQFVCGQGQMADVLSHLVLGPASRNGYEVPTSQHCRIKEHHERVKASLKNLGSVVRKLKDCQAQQQTQHSQQGLLQQQHHMQMQQQQATQILGARVGTVLSSSSKLSTQLRKSVLDLRDADSSADTAEHRQQAGTQTASAQYPDKKAALPSKKVVDHLEGQAAPAAGQSSAHSASSVLQLQQKPQVFRTQVTLQPQQPACRQMGQPASTSFSHSDQQQHMTAVPGSTSVPYHCPEDKSQQQTAVTDPGSTVGLGQKQRHQQQQQRQRQLILQPQIQHSNEASLSRHQDDHQQQQRVEQQQQQTGRVQHPVRYPLEQPSQPPGQHLSPSAERPYGWWREGQGLWAGIDPVRQRLLQVHNTLSNSSNSSTEQVLAVLEPTSREHAAAAQRSSKQADQVGARLQKAWKQLQITGGSAAEQQQPQQQHEQQQHEQQQRQQSHPALGPSNMNFQHVQVRSQRLQQQQIQRQHQEAKDKALAAIGSVFPTSPSKQIGAGKRLQRAAAAAAARVWQPAADGGAEVVEEGNTAEGDRSAQHDQYHVNRGKPPVPRQIKKPYQPKRVDDDPNWKQARFMSVLDHGIECPAALQAKHSRPEHSTARFAVLVMLHNAGFPNHLFWERWVDTHPAGDVALVVHMKAGVAIGPGMVGHPTINNHKLKTSLEARWGDISLVEATIASIAETLVRCPAATHIALASGHDIPVHLMTPGVLLPGVSSFGMYQFGDEEQDILQKACHEELMYYTESTPGEADNWVQSLTFHHQWMVLCREHAAAVVKLRSEINVIGRVMHKACNSVKADMAPDEFIIVTALRAHGYIRSIQRVEMREGMHFPPGTLLNCYPTMVIFPAESSPHPVLWTDPDEKVKCQLEDEATRQRHSSMLSLRRCLSICQEKAALFFRKVEIRQTRCEQQIELLSLLEQMWAGKSLRKAVNSRTSSAASGSRGTKRKRVSSGAQQTRSESKEPVGRGISDNSRGASPMPTAAGDDSDSEGLDVQSPLKKPATAKAVMEAAAAVAAAVSGLEVAPAVMSGGPAVITAADVAQVVAC